jgi:hypothetical protein
MCVPAIHVQSDKAGTRAFSHSMYSVRDIIDETQMEMGLETLRHDHPQLAVCARRFVGRKSMREAIAAAPEARRRRSFVEYRLFGSEPREVTLHRHATQPGVGGVVPFCNFVEYNPAFIAQDVPRVNCETLVAEVPLAGGGASPVEPGGDSLK